VETYGETYKDANGNPKVPDSLAALAYDATNMMIAAIQRAGVDDPTQAKDALLHLAWHGVTSDISFDAQHNPIKNAVVMAVKNGRVIYLTTVNPVSPAP
jgi:branched-chain amino acid transport system substrate-binding protein